MDVWQPSDAVRALADLGHDVTLGDSAAAGNGGRAELEQRHRVAVGGQDRQRAAAVWDRADERDDAGGRSAHGSTDRLPDIDTAVLAGGVLVLREGERPQDGAGRRPGPPGRDRDEDQGRDRSDDRDGENAPHQLPPS
jgi:hypothetical protein